jgi:hypothetical protein
VATDYQTVGFDLQRRLQAEVAEVNADPTLSPIGKNEKITALREAAQSSLNDIRDKQLRCAADRRKTLESKLFGRAAGEGNDPTLVVSYRDAAERVAALEGNVDTSKAVSLMRTAIHNGDVPLRKMLLRSAYDNQWAEVINAYAEAFPSSDADVNELWDARYPSARNDFINGLADVGAFNLHGDQPLNQPGTPAMVTQNVQERRNALALTLGLETEVDRGSGDAA